MTAALHPVKIGVLSELDPGEHRVALVPEVAARLSFPHFQVRIEAGAGLQAGYSDADYRRVGVLVERDRRVVLRQSDVVLSIKPVRLEDIPFLRSGAATISSLRPDVHRVLIEALAARGVAAFSLDVWLRLSRGQKEEALSSQFFSLHVVQLLTSLIHNGALNMDWADDSARNCCVTYAWKIVDKSGRNIDQGQFLSATAR